MYAHSNQSGWDDGFPPGDVVEASSTLLRMLADPTRMRILWLLRERELDVTSLTESLGAARPAVSQHLAKLKLAGLVQVRKDGRRSLYRTRGIHVAPLLEAAFGAGDHQVNDLPDHASAME